LDLSVEYAPKADIAGTSGACLASQNRVCIARRRRPAPRDMLIRTNVREVRAIKLTRMRVRHIKNVEWRAAPSRAHYGRSAAVLEIGGRRGAIGDCV
jgi:hypothetical protein